MAEAATVRSDQLWSVGYSRVYTAPALGTDWTERPYLYCDVLTMAAAPAIDQAAFRYELGEFAVRHENPFGGNAGPTTQVPFTSLNRQYVKVEVLDESGAVQLTWYGRIEIDQQTWHYPADVSSTKTGTQAFVAFGLIADLDRTPIVSSQVYNGSDVVEVGRGVGFNVLRNDNQGAVGNSTDVEIGTAQSYVFSGPLSRNFDAYTEREWRASDAVEYLRVHHFPDDITWEVEGDATALDWYRIAVETDRRSVKAVLDELIDRRRLCGYWVYGVEAEGEFIGRVRVFTFVDSELKVGAETIAANANQVDLNAVASNLTGDPQIHNLSTQVADTLIVEGEPIVSVATFSVQTAGGMETNGLVQGWLDADATAYATASGDEERATRERAKAEYADVFARFYLDASWSGQVVDPEDSGTTVKAILHIDDLPGREELAAATLADVFAPDSPYRVGAMYPEDGRFLRAVPWKASAAGAADPVVWRAPACLFLDGRDWRHCNHINGEDTDRQWSCSLDILDDAMGVRLEVNQEGGQQLIAATAWSDESPGSVPEALDPESPTSHALDYLDMFATLAFQWDDRCQVRSELSEPTGLERTQVIRVRDAHLWIEIPQAVTDVTKDGELVVSEGRVLRDDRDRLEQIATAATEWYGTERQALRMTYKDSLPVLNIGDLVTALTTGGTSEPIRTAVTGLVIDLRNHTTAIETSYAEADFS